MTMLEKIIYIADYIEPNRKIIPGLQEIRETVFVDINHAICLCAGNTVNYLRKNGNSRSDEHLKLINIMTKENKR